MRDTMEESEFSGNKVLILITDVGQGRGVGFFSNIVKGIKTHA